MYVNPVVGWIFMMNRFYKSIIHIFVLFLCIFNFLAVVSPGIAQSENSFIKVVKVGWFSSYGFQETDKEDGTRSGYSYEYLTRIANYSNWEFEFVQGEWSDLFTKLENGEIDLLAGVSVTDERKEHMLFPDYMMGMDNYWLFQHEYSRIMNPSDLTTLSGRKIGGVKNNRMTTFLESWAKQNNVDFDIVYYDGFGERDKDFADNKIEGIVATDNNIMVDSGYSPVVKVGQEPFYLAVAKGRPDLLSDLNYALAYIDRTDPFFIKKLQFSHYGATLVNSTLADDEELWLRDHKTWRVGFVRNYMPFSDQDDDGAITGIIRDVFKSITEKLHISDRMSVEYVPYDDFDEMGAALKQHDVDMIFPVIGDERYSADKNFSFTSEVVNVPMYVAYKGDYSDKTFDTIALSYGSIKKIMKSYSHSKVEHYDSVDECLDAILDGEATCTIVSSYYLKERLNDPRYRGIKTMPLGVNLSYCISVPRDQTALISILNKGIALMDKAVMSDYIFKYIQAGTRFTVEDFIRENSVVVVAIGGMVFLIILAGLYLYLNGVKMAKDEVEIQLKRNEKLTAEKEAQLKEITALNELSQERQRMLSDALKKVNQYNDALVHDCTYFYEFDVTSGLISGNFTSSSDYNPLFGLSISFPIKYDEFNRIRAQQLEMEALTPMEAELWTCKGLERDFANGKRAVEIRYKSNKLNSYWTATIILTEDTTNSHLNAVYICKETTEVVRAEQRQRRTLERALAKAEKASAAKSDFLSRMSHDIRTPLNGIIGLLEINDRHKDDTELLDANRKKARVAANHLLSLINDVLDMSKLEDGSVELAEEPFNIEELCSEVLDICSIRAKENGIVVINDMKEGLKYPDVYGSPLHFKQILMNLVNNAIKYNNPGGTISFSAQLGYEDEETVAYDFTIKDTGIGISKEFLQHIFEPFTQEKNDARSRYQGTGMGMAIVKALVDKMQGKIAVDSAVGEGTTFVVTLPFKINFNAEKSREEEASSATSIEGMRLLLVEDNELNMEIARTILEDAGAIITSAENGHVAYDIFMAEPPGSFDAILMDIMMPDWDGYETTSRIRSSQKADGQTIPIIAMTANTFADDIQKSKKYGMNAHIGKPLNVDVLMTTLEKFRGK